MKKNIKLELSSMPVPTPTSWYLEKGREYQKLKDEGKEVFKVTSENRYRFGYDPMDITQSSFAPSFDDVLVSYMEKHKYVVAVQEDDDSKSQDVLYL